MPKYNCSFAPGDWQGLDATEQRPRYEAIAAMLKRHELDASVLDVGCGEGVLRGYLKGAYCGIEPCLEAATQASQNTKGLIFYDTAEEWLTEGHTLQFHSIVFNESLYYCSDPVYVLRRYARYLCPKGAILISIYQKPGRIGLKKRIAHWLDRRKPMSNRHCEAMLLAYQCRERWVMIDRTEVGPWHIWLARQRVCSPSTQTT